MTNNGSSLMDGSKKENIQKFLTQSDQESPVISTIQRQIVTAETLMLLYCILCVVTFLFISVSQIFGSLSPDPNSFIPTSSYGTVCPKQWDFYQGRCFFLSTSELSWNRSKDFCERESATLAIVNTLEKLKFLQNITSAEKYFIGLIYQHAEKRWRWINNSAFNGNVTNWNQNFNCATIGLTKTFDAALCDTSYRSICEKNAK
ncbi:PREDICTED: C-type lectin domain family 5 member A [Propithecus coquereli]|uniref:C-type lectin domain family 5 member A n=1 Tax=Propithecus coquereli TaxID=379532 RepID=UPI00063FA81A|nr:PREDICTED: C-type lectin domain family 5 member A [Propithecus coquereli]